MPAYPTRAANTNNMQAKIHTDMALKASTFGEFDIIELKMLISTRNNVTNNVIRPGTISGPIRKLA